MQLRSHKGADLGLETVRFGRRHSENRLAESLQHQRRDVLTPEHEHEQLNPLRRPRPVSFIDLLGNQIQLMFVVAQAAVPHVKTGKLRALAVSSAKRSASLPDLPTIAESGYPRFDVTGWLGVHVPPKTAPALIERMNASINKALQSDDVRSRMSPAGMDAASSTPAQFGTFVRNDIARYAKVVKDAHIKVE